MYFSPSISDFAGNTGAVNASAVLSSDSSATFVPTFDMVAARDSILAMRERIAQTRPTILAVQLKVLAAGRWAAATPVEADETRKVVLVPDQINMLSDADRKSFTDACLKCYTALNIPVNARGDCPLASMKDRLEQLETNLFTAMSCVTKLSSIGALGLPAKFREDYVQRCLDMIDNGLRASRKPAWAVSSSH